MSVGASGNVIIILLQLPSTTTPTESYDVVVVVVVVDGGAVEVDAMATGKRCTNLSTNCCKAIDAGALG